MAEYTSNGGGATHIAKRTGLLSTLSSYTSDILMVSGGGGGGMLVDSTVYDGADAGGVAGNHDNSADQTTGNAFGQGESGTDVSGGGSGLYGGYKGTSSKSGGAGSGYIGNSLLSNKKMVGYNVPTSSAEGTKTESVNEASENPVANKPKIGNGFARIKQITTIKSNALFVGANTEVVSLHKGSSNRKYLKLYDDYSICVMYYDSDYQYYGPLFLSTSENGVKYKTTGDRAYESTDFSTTIINGVSWKLAWSRYWLEYPDNDEDWNLPVISGVLPNNADYWNYQYDAQEVTTLINAILNAAKE